MKKIAIFKEGAAVIDTDSNTTVFIGSGMEKPIETIDYNDDNMLKHFGITTAEVTIEEEKFKSGIITQEAELIIEPVIEPIIEPIVEPVIDPIIEPVVDPIVEPIPDPII